MNKIFTISWQDLGDAIAIGIIFGLMAVGGYVLNNGDLFTLDVHTLFNTFGLAVIGSIVGLLKNFLTDENGKFAGLLPTVKKE